MSRYPEPGEQHQSRRPAEAPRPQPMASRAPAEQKGGGLLGGLEGLGRLLPEKIGELETEDIILLLILYLMYKESGDSELLIIMGGLFLL